jgi:hypothetical protein
MLRAQLTTAALIICMSLPGCVTLEPLVRKHDTPPTGQVTQVAVTWDKTIAFVPDFTHGGAMTPGLMCRVYLIGADGAVPVAGDGNISIDLYDDTPLIAGGQSVLKEKWNLDNDTLKGCMRKDLVGWAYTLFLPCATYSLDIKQVHLMVRYTPVHGVPFYSPSQTMALIHPETGHSAAAEMVRSPDNHATQTASQAGSPQH